MNDVFIGLICFSLFLVPVILATLLRVPMDEGHGAYAIDEQRRRNQLRAK